MDSMIVPRDDRQKIAFAFDTKTVFVTNYGRRNTNSFISDRKSPMMTLRVWMWSFLYINKVDGA